MLIRLRLIILLAVAIATTTVLPATAAKRAFVVGINRYDKLGPPAQLERAINDAASVATVLREIGYDVTQQKDLSRRAFNSAWQTFLNTVTPLDEVAIYYAGHGIEIDGQNFLLPSDMPLIRYGRETQVKRESIPLQELLLDLRTRKPRVSVIILDACRNHPLIPREFRSAAAIGGLANVTAPEGTFIMYSAGAGETALDRLPEGDPDTTNSVYTRYLLPLLKTPGISLAEMAVKVRRNVYQLAQTVSHVQRPAYYDGVIGRYCMAGCRSGNDASRPTAAASANKPQPAATPAAAPALPARNPNSKTAPGETPQQEQLQSGCTEIGRRLATDIRLRVGMKLCDRARRNEATVTRIANRYVVFLDNGMTSITCRQGILCGFNWPDRPMFRIEARADPARGIPPTGRMRPR